MSNGYYPIMLQLRGRRCVVVGGGTVAERKLKGLLEADADSIIVISPAPSCFIKQLADQQIIELRTREYREEDAQGADLLFAATNHAAVNRRAVADARRYGALVQLSDDGTGGDFITPAVVRRGDLLLAVTTSGSSPALAGAIRRELESIYHAEYEGWTKRLKQLRAYAYETLGESCENRERIHAALRLAADDAQLALKDDSYNNNMDLGEWLTCLLHRTDRRT